MRIARFSTHNGPRFAEWQNSHWQFLDGEIATRLTPNGERVPTTARMLAPCDPRVIVGMAHNALPEGRFLPPQAFLKSSRTVIGPEDPIFVNPDLGTVNVETELAIVIGRAARNLTRANALDSVFGYTIGNDVTAADQASEDTLLLQAKNGDGYTPLGPWIETSLNSVDALTMHVFVNGVKASTGSTSELANLVIDQLIHVTRYLSLGPGDIILGGCPGSFAAVLPGDRVRLEIDGLGYLQNSVHRAAASASSSTAKEDHHGSQR